jgi:protein-L-isoaspartate(D-aspartate) O-methyltransferase
MNFLRRCSARTAFYEFSGARDPEVDQRLKQAIANSRGGEIKSVRSDHHAEDEICWLHGEGWCLSRRDPDGSKAAA